MNVIACNGSPRKHKNTATLLEHALQGAAKAGARTELVHLYDLTFQGCRSCFACKLKGGKSYGICAVQDELSPLLATIRECDVLLLGSPFYFCQETGVMRCFMERLFFPSLVYDQQGSSLFPHPLKTALFYTMNIKESDIPVYGKDKVIERTSGYMRRLFGSCELLLCTDTLQFDDYTLYEASRFDAAAKLARHGSVFAEDCRKAFELGARLAGA